MKKIFNNLLEIVFPRNCLGCNRSKTDLCPNCLSKLTPASGSNDIDLIATFNYQDRVVRNIVQALKYKKRKTLTKMMSLEMNTVIKNELKQRNLAEEKYILIPIPLHADKMFTRGFNQSELLATAIAKHNQNFTVKTNILIKTKPTLDQASIQNKTQRQANIKNVFKVKNKNLIKNENIIIIDDVATTGATFNEAKKMLKRAGAKSVKGLVFAH